MAVDRRQPVGHARMGTREDPGLRSPEEVAGQIVHLNRRIGVNHLIMSIQWPGMPQSLALETMHLFAEEVFPRVRRSVP